MISNINSSNYFKYFIHRYTYNLIRYSKKESNIYLDKKESNIYLDKKENHILLIYKQ